MASKWCLITKWICFLSFFFPHKQGNGNYDSMNMLHLLDLPRRKKEKVQEKKKIQPKKIVCETVNFGSTKIN